MTTREAATALVAHLRAEARRTRDMSQKVVLLSAINAVCASYGVPNSAKDAADVMRDGDLGVTVPSPRDESKCDHCGHTVAAHYNARSKFGRKPCHHMGSHDMRCECRDLR